MRAHARPHMHAHVGWSFQSATGCAANMWRYNLDGYLREILTARVYDVAVSATRPLESFAHLSAVGRSADRHCSSSRAP